MVPSLALTDQEAAEETDASSRSKSLMASMWVTLFSVSCNKYTALLTETDT